jgi:hypothetical protein
MHHEFSTTKAIHWRICVDSDTGMYCFADDGQNPTGEALL